MTEQGVPTVSAYPSLLDMNRRRFLRGAVVAGGGLAAAAVAACTPSASIAPWVYAPVATPSGIPAATGIPAPTAAATHDHGGTTPAPGSTPTTSDHDANALAVVKRFLDGEGAALDGAGNQPYGDPKLDGTT
jgi:hypothetical protein